MVAHCETRKRDSVWPSGGSGARFGAKRRGANGLALVFEDVHGFPVQTAGVGVDDLRVLCFAPGFLQPREVGASGPLDQGGTVRIRPVNAL